MSLSTELSTNNKTFNIVPTTFNEAMNYAKLICESSFCPREFKGKSGDVLVAMQMGAEVGLSPMQALQNIAVINGKPCIWGDAALALVISHPCYVSHHEWFEGSISDGTLTAYCSITRKNAEPYIKSFSMDDAKKAGLLSKQGVWQNYLSRMLQMRARGFCIRDKFADALRGINVREEVEDYKIHVIKKQEVKNITPAIKEEIVTEIEIKDQHDIDQDLLDISWAQNLDDLHTIYKKSYKYWAKEKNKDNLQKIMEAKDKKKDELENIETVNVETGEIK